MNLEKFQIGDHYGGGIVFWVDASGQHGLIAATEDQSKGIQWHNDRITGATEDGIGAGKENTSLIMLKGAGNFAAKVCDDLEIIADSRYYNDWYLPSKYELNLLYLQKEVVGGFSSYYYWSSTEYGSDSACLQNFDNGHQHNDFKRHTLRVRAVRAF